MGSPSGGLEPGKAGRGSGELAAAPSDPASYRSMPSLVTGIALLLFGAALALDAVIEGAGRGPWIAAVSIVGLGVLAYALAIRPVVRVDDTSILIRNPFRDVALPWDVVTEIRSAYSVEVLVTVAEGRQRRYQLWAVPVSLHARKRVNRANVRSAGRLGAAGSSYGEPAAPQRSLADQVVDELRDRHAHYRDAPRPADASAGGVRIAWCWPVFGGIAAAALALVLLLLF
jgi:hypothetical protein